MGSTIDYYPVPKRFRKLRTEFLFFDMLSPNGIDELIRLT